MRDLLKYKQFGWGFNESLEKQGKPYILAFGGGKGGVGKSFVSSSLAIAIAREAKVAIIDLDLGAANTHTHLGGEIPKKSLSHYVDGKVESLEEIASPTNVRNLDLFSGVHDNLDIASMGETKWKKLVDGIFKLNYDFVILDLGAGTTKSTLEFFLMAHKSILVITPEPTSIENAYRFIKSAYYQLIKSLEQKHNLAEQIAAAMADKGNLQIKTPKQLLTHLKKLYPEQTNNLIQDIQKLQMQIIVNQVRSGQDFQMCETVIPVCQKYFGLECEILGGLHFDNAVWQSLRRRKNIFAEAPHSSISREISAIARKLVHPKNYKAVV